MKCFYHHGDDAIAICKSCNRGVCQVCAIEIENGIACKDRCEAEVSALNNLIQRNKTSHQKTSTAYAQNAIWMSLAGMVFVGFGIMEARRTGSVVFTVLGLIFLMGAFFNYSSSRKWKGGN